MRTGSETTGALPVVRTPIWREYKPYPVLRLKQLVVELYRDLIHATTVFSPYRAYNTKIKGRIRGSRCLVRNRHGIQSCSN